MMLHDIPPEKPKETYGLNGLANRETIDRILADLDRLTTRPVTQIQNQFDTMRWVEPANYNPNYWDEVSARYQIPSQQIYRYEDWLRNATDDTTT